MARKPSKTKKYRAQRRDQEVEDYIAAVLAVRGIETERTEPTETAVRKGRPKGAGSLAKQDGPLLSEMNVLILKENISSHAAARRVADRAQGGGTFESKVRRLEKRYKKTFG
ncbi:MAG: hypothetical protein OEU46_14940 [Alphaproteobacteria bacterium]|nr:hypothetical protein [Alphaproteobacteria bacterium]